MKDLLIKVAGSEEPARDVTIKPGTTAKDILEGLGLKGYLLSKGPEDPPFGESENVYPLVENGSKLFASLPAEVGGTLLGPSAHSCLSKVIAWFKEGSITVTSSKIMIEPRNKIVVERSKKPYWQERGWKRHRWMYTGYYRTRYGSWDGKIENITCYPKFYIHNPPSKLQQHPHWECFICRGRRWFLIHFKQNPRNIDSGIIQVERIINEAFRI
ncbi:hypothetical protein KAW65_00410 [candidate division WOR-3 bacterium]|nr:hypothetical protein [candidate division WOR-3 bacterium]